MQHHIIGTPLAHLCFDAISLEILVSEGRLDPCGMPAGRAPCAALSSWRRQAISLTNCMFSCVKRQPGQSSLEGRLAERYRERDAVFEQGRPGKENVGLVLQQHEVSAFQKEQQTTTQQLSSIGASSDRRLQASAIGMQIGTTGVAATGAS